MVATQLPTCLGGRFRYLYPVLVLQVEVNSCQRNLSLCVRVVPVSFLVMNSLLFFYIASNVDGALLS